MVSPAAIVPATTTLAQGSGSREKPGVGDCVRTIEFNRASRAIEREPAVDCPGRSTAADEDHAFGHTSAEDLAALGQAIFILIAAGVIAFAAAQRLLDPSTPQLQAQGRGMVAMALSVVLTLGLVWWQGRVARATGSRVVAADRLHYLGDLLPNIGAIVSLWASSAYGMGQIDSVVAIGAAVMLALGALRIGKGAFDALMDRRADPAIIAGIGKIAVDWPGVHGYHDLKTRTAGSRIFVNIHIELDGSQTLREAHDIGAGLRRAILNAYPQTDVIIHKDVVGET
jgi:ferrous-iron efflux pump FieF